MATEDINAERRAERAPIIMLGLFSLLAVIIGYGNRDGIGAVIMITGVLGFLAAIVIGVVKASKQSH